MTNDAYQRQNSGILKHQLTFGVGWSGILAPMKSFVVVPASGNFLKMVTHEAKFNLTFAAFATYDENFVTCDRGENRRKKHDKVSKTQKIGLKNVLFCLMFVGFQDKHKKNSPLRQETLQKYIKLTKTLEASSSSSASALIMACIIVVSNIPSTELVCFATSFSLNSSISRNVLWHTEIIDFAVGISCAKKVFAPPQT
jgi:hypothetical protein